MFNECMEEKTKKVIFPGGFLGIVQRSEDGVVFDGGTEKPSCKTYSDASPPFDNKGM